MTCHDGFTLNDLVSYNGKHNEANGEDNRDGNDDNMSWNCGVEGPTDDPAVKALRAADPELRHPAHAVAGRADAGGRRRDRPHPAGATTMPTARTTRSVGSTGTLVGEANRDLLRFWTRLLELPRDTTACCGGATSTPGRPDDRGIPDLAWHGTDLAPPDWDDHRRSGRCASRSRARMQVMMNMYSDAGVPAAAIPGRAGSGRSTPPLPGTHDIAGTGHRKNPSTHPPILVSGRSFVVLVSRPV